MSCCVVLSLIAFSVWLCTAVRVQDAELDATLAELTEQWRQKLVNGQKNLGADFFDDGACARAHGDWLFTGDHLGHGAVGQINIVRDNQGKAYAMKSVGVKSHALALTRGIQVTRKGLAKEIAAQTIAASMGLAVPVVDAFLCGQTVGKKAKGIIIMPIIKGVELANYINAAGTAEPVQCEIKYLPPAPTVNGSMSLKTYEELKSGIARLNNAGVFVSDFHGGNAMVEKGTGKIIFVDFGFAHACVKEPAVVGWAFGRLGCSIPPIDKDKPEFEDSFMIECVSDV